MLSTDSNNPSAHGDNFELLLVCFKVIANLIRDCSHFNLNEEQLQVLMYYAERNLYDNLKQSSAFNLIKAILSRKLKCDELNDVLGKIMKLSIQADSANVRLQSRQTILQYILDYSLPEKKLVKFLEFYIVQLAYEYENGRESALEMLATIFNTFPTVSLIQQIFKSFFIKIKQKLFKGPIEFVCDTFFSSPGGAAAQRRVGQMQKACLHRHSTPHRKSKLFRIIFCGLILLRLTKSYF